MLITGCSTGIGEASALQLAQKGFRVLAGVRQPADAERLRSMSPNIEPIFLDVTNPEQIEAAAELVAETVPHGLDALVNNAGVGVVGPVEDLTVEEWRSAIEVNLIGAVAVTRALLPSILRARGRVINVSSGAGRIAFPLFGPYTVSKFALEAFTDVLRREVGHQGVKVICVQPGVIATPIYAKGLGTHRSMLGLIPDDVAHRYAALLASAKKSATEAPSTARPASEVADAVLRALVTRRPRVRYVVGTDAKMASLAARFIPDRLQDFVIARLTAS